MAEPVLPASRSPIQTALAIERTMASSDQGPPSAADQIQQVFKITPSLIFVGIITGVAFALGAGLVHRYVFGVKPVTEKKSRK